MRLLNYLRLPNGFRLFRKMRLLPKKKLPHNVDASYIFSRLVTSYSLGVNRKEVRPDGVSDTPTQQKYPLMTMGRLANDFPCVQTIGAGTAWPLRRHDAFALTVSMLGQGLSFYYYELNCLKVFYSALHHKVELGMDLFPSQFSLNS